MNGAAPQTDLVRGAPEWVTVLGDLGLGWVNAGLVAGDQAAAVAAAYQAAGGPPVAYDRPDLAFLGRAAPPDLDAATPRLTGLEASSLDLVVLRHAWDGMPGLEAAMSEARRVLRPGGVLLAADLEVDRLMTAPARRFPSQILFARHPSILATLARSIVTATQMAMTANRARFVSLSADSVDETRRSFESADDFVAWAIGGGWRGIDLLAAAERTDLADELRSLAPTLAPLGPIVDREPWAVLRARAPA